MTCSIEKRFGSDTAIMFYNDTLSPFSLAKVLVGVVKLCIPEESFPIELLQKSPFLR